MFAYMRTGKYLSKNGGNMLKRIFILISVLLLASCVTNETQIQDVLNKNPKLLFDLIENNPEQFIDVINRAAQKVQKIQYDKQMSQIKTEQENDLKNPKQAKLDDERRLIGSNNSEITIVEYADFQCPACKMAFDNLNRFKEKYAGKVQFFYKHMPLDFHKMAYPAALYFEAIKLQDKNKAMKFFDYVYQNQRQLTDDSFLKKIANSIGINMSKLMTDIKSEKIKKIIENDMSEFQNFGFTGTPVILLNGVALHGAQSIDELERILKLTSKSKK